MEVDFSRCVSCFNCFRACNLNGFKYKFSYSPKNVILPTETDISKRNFIFTTSAFVFGLFSGLLAQTKTIIVTKASTIRENKKNEVLPPGAKSFEHFTSKCTACHLCVSICCNQVLQPSFFELGAASIMQPRMDYHIGFCNYECNDCSKVCPTGAILPVDLSYKKRIQLGKSKFIKDNCIVITEKTECGACSEHCPTKAVKMVPYKGLFLPEVKEKICIGCGACEFACPTMPYKAIYVEGNPVHVTADKPEEKQYILNVTGKQLQQNALKNKMEKIKQEQDTKQKDDFPF
jgi:ferredoxin